MTQQGDVEFRMAACRFSAKRAAVWMQSVPGAAGKDTQQVFVYFEQLGSAGDPAGSVSMTSERLPVRGVIEVDGNIELKPDLLMQAPPGAAVGQAAFLQDAE